MLTEAALMLYPSLLPATTDPAYDLTVYTAQTRPYSRSVGLIWWLGGSPWRSVTLPLWTGRSGAKLLRVNQGRLNEGFFEWVAPEAANLGLPP
jgi:hypothetical protein